MVPISKSIYQNSLQEYRLIFFIVLTANFLYLAEKNLFRKWSESSLPNFSGCFCAVCLNVCDFLLKSCFLSTKARKRVRPPAAELCCTGGLTQEIIVYMFVYILLSFRVHAFCAAFFLVAWMKTASIATAKMMPTGYARAVL